jgi:hypothetical protein
VAAKGGEQRDWKELDLPAVSVYRFLSGKIVESRMLHFNTAALLNLLGDADR